MIKLFKGSYNELKKVRWAKKDEILTGTTIVLSVSIVLVSVFALLDVGINFIKSSF